MTRQSTILLATILLSAAFTTSAAAQGGRFGWHSDLKQAAALSAQTGKPLFVVFRCER